MQEVCVQLHLVAMLYVLPTSFTLSSAPSPVLLLLLQRGDPLRPPQIGASGKADGPGERRWNGEGKSKTKSKYDFFLSLLFLKERHISWHS